MHTTTRELLAAEAELWWAHRAAGRADGRVETGRALRVLGASQRRLQAARRAWAEAGAPDVWENGETASRAAGGAG